VTLARRCDAFEDPPALEPESRSLYIWPHADCRLWRWRFHDGMHGDLDCSALQDSIVDRGEAYALFDMPRLYALLIVLFVLSIGVNALISRLE
jgi:hypothetical protein